MSHVSRRGLGRRAIVALTIGALTVAFAAPVAEAASPKNKRANLKNNGTQVTDDGSYLPNISTNGRFITFYTDSDQLSAKDSNGQRDIYIRDLKLKKTRLVSVRSNGKQGNDQSFISAVSGNGRFIAFDTLAKTLFKNDKNGDWDVLVRDRKTGKTQLVSKSSKGARGNKGSSRPDITPDGRYVVFESRADNLVPGDTKGKVQIFIHDRRTGKTKLVSKSTSGDRGDGHSADPSVSANGRFIAFESAAENLVDGDTNSKTDIFVHDRKKKKTWRASVNTGGGQIFGAASHNPEISGDGKLIAFETNASLVSSDAGGDKRDIYVHNRATRKTRHVSLNNAKEGGDDVSDSASISVDGRFVAFASVAENLVLGDSNNRRDIFVHDRKEGKTRRVSIGVNGADPGAGSDAPSVSKYGKFVAFDSGAENLKNSDTNGETDIFRRGPLR